MKISKIMISNILGIKHLNVSPGKINVIDGANGSGKTSFLEAIKIAVGGGHDATLLRNGEEKGEIVLQFDTGMKLTKTIGVDKSKITLKDELGGVVPRAATYLKNIVDTVGLNPIQFLTATPKAQVDMLLNSVDFEYDRDKFEDIIGKKLQSEPANIVETTDQIRKGFYDSRTVINSALKEKKVMVDQVRESMPKGVVANFAEEHQSIKTELEGLKTTRADRLECIRIDRQAAKDTLRDSKDELKADIADRHFKSLRDIEKIRDDALDALNLKFATEIEKVDKDAEVCAASTRINWDKKIEEVAGKEAVAAEKVAETDQYESNIKYIDEGKAYIDLKTDESEELTERIKQLDEFKVDLLKNIPIAGLDIVNGQMLLDGVLFETVNEAKRIQFCLNMANLRGLELPLVCLDGLEAMDHKSFDLFVKEAEKTNMQFFVTRVTEDESLNIK